jgi:hypothetical protein
MEASAAQSSTDMGSSGSPGAMTAARRTDMRDTSRLFHSAVIACLFLLLAGIGTSTQAQERMTIQTTARGTGTQLGKLFHVKIIIEQLSTPDDQKALIDAFALSGHKGVLDALTRMSPKGRIALEGTVGNDVKYIRELPAKNGRHFRLVTDRNLAFGEVRNSTRSSEYDIGAVELTITPDGEGSGTLLPACKLKLNKQKEIEIESYQNPWKLTHFIVHKD